jgi:CspA family cold shock protein
MANGTVKWFNNAKGYGFVLPEEGGEDLFVHYSAIEMDGYKTLKAGQDVQFDIVEGPKGLHAVNIQDVEGDDTESADLGVSVEFDIDEEPEVGESHIDDASTPDVSSA